MKYLVEQNLENFEFWGGAKTFAKLLTTDELRKIEENIEDCYSGNPPTETEINDIFWFDECWIADILGFCHSDVPYYRGTEKHWFYPDNAEFYSYDSISDLFKYDSLGYDSVDEFIEGECFIDVDEQ